MSNGYVWASRTNGSRCIRLTFYNHDVGLQTVRHTARLQAIILCRDSSLCHDRRLGNLYLLNIYYYVCIFFYAVQRFLLKHKSKHKGGGCSTKETENK
jgi:hypothetical protein